MDRRFLEWKEKETTNRLLDLTRTALLTGIASGITIYLLIDAAIRCIEKGGLYVIWCIILGIVFGIFIRSIAKDYKDQIRRAINPLIWDLRILHDRNIRLEKQLTEENCSEGTCTTLDEIENTVDDDEVEYVGEHERREDDKSEND